MRGPPTSPPPRDDPDYRWTPEETRVVEDQVIETQRGTTRSDRFPSKTRTITFEARTVEFDDESFDVRDQDLIDLPDRVTHCLLSINEDWVDGDLDRIEPTGDQYVLGNDVCTITYR